METKIDLPSTGVSLVCMCTFIHDEQHLLEWAKYSRIHTIDFLIAHARQCSPAYTPIWFDNLIRYTSPESHLRHQESADLLFIVRSTAEL